MVKIIKLEQHDTKGIDRAISQLPTHNKSIILLADTGYLSESKRIELAKKHITLITPYRKEKK